MSKQLKNELKENIKGKENWVQNLFNFQLEALERKIRFWTFTRFVKTHLPLELLPRNIYDSGAKVFFILDFQDH